MDISIDPKSDKYIIQFPYDPELVEFCRSLQGARYMPTGKYWTAPRTTPNALDLQQWGFKDDKVLSTGVVVKQGTYNWEVQATLYQHQRDWLEHLMTIPKGMLIADMGLGKTLMAMQWLAGHKVDPEDTVVICPKSLIKNWQRELFKFTGVDSVPVLGGTAVRKKALRASGLHIVNYEYFALNEECRRYLNNFHNKSCVILDESHRCKDPRSQRSKKLFEYCIDKSNVLLLTGTPISQGAQDYFSQSRMFKPLLLGSSFTSFKHRYCDEEEVRGAPTGVTRITGYKNIDELTRLLSPYMRTYRKTECLDLPDKVYNTRYVQLGPEQARRYKQIKNDMATWLSTGEEVTASNVLTRLIRFSQVTQGFLSSDDGTHEVFKGNPKLDALSDIIDDVGKEPLVVMHRFIKDSENICQLLEKKRVTFASIRGGISSIERDKIVQDFRAGKFQVLVGQIRVAGVGFNMEHCKTMVFFSNEYSLTDRLQAEDRIHRITSTRDVCLYIDIQAEHTVDEHIITALRNKRNVAEELATLRKHFET